MTNPNELITPAEKDALQRLVKIAMRDTGQSRRAADFLLAWHNAGENGGWDPTDLWAVDEEIKLDMIAVIQLIADSRAEPGELGYKAEIQRIWKFWRGGKNPRPAA